MSGRDLATLFVVRATELYLRSHGGRLAFVMPDGALTRKPPGSFRTGLWTLAAGGVLNATMLKAWNLSKAATGFPMTSCVNSADLTPGTSKRIPATVESWRTTGAASNVTWAQIEPRTTVTEKTLQTTAETDTGPELPYQTRFRQVAILLPRVLPFVEELSAGPLGAGQGPIQVRSRRSTQEKTPWKNAPGLQGPVEKAFVRPVHLGETVLPYRTLEPLRAVIPVHPNGTRLLTNTEASQLVVACCSVHGRQEGVVESMCW